MTTIRFHDALRRAALALRDPGLPEDKPVPIIRVIYGGLRFAVDCAAADFPPEARQYLEATQSSLSPYATGENLLFRESFSFPERLFGSSDWHRSVISLGVNEDDEPLGETEVSLHDRQVTGQDWLRPTDEAMDHPHRVVLFGLKGGVGRSTALCMVVWGLAKAGKRVLLVAFDLESPGLSGLVLPAEKVAEFGVMDWLIEDAVGQGDSVLGGMVSASPLGETTQGAVRVAAAMGQQEIDYMAKLARAYADVPGALFLIIRYNPGTAISGLVGH